MVEYILYLIEYYIVVDIINHIKIRNRSIRKMEYTITDTVRKMGCTITDSVRKTGV